MTALSHSGNNGSSRRLTEKTNANTVRPTSIHFPPRSGHPLLLYPLLSSQTLPMSPLYALHNLRAATRLRLESCSDPVTRLALQQQFKNLTHRDNEARVQVSLSRTRSTSPIRCGLSGNGSAPLKQDKASHWSWDEGCEKKNRLLAKTSACYATFFGHPPEKHVVLKAVALGGWKKSFGPLSFLLNLPADIRQQQTAKLEELYLNQLNS